MVFICLHMHRGRVFQSFLSLKKIFTLVAFIFFIFECIHLTWFVILVSLRSENHIFHNYHTMIEIDTLINVDGAHKFFFANFKKCEYETT